MGQVNRTALVPYTVAQMYALVADVERYPEFVPWLKSVQVIERKDTELVAMLELERAGLHERFTTRNTHEEPTRIAMELVKGPFKKLNGAWTFTPLADRGAKIGLSLYFEFSNPILSLVLAKVFEQSCNQLVDAFTTRAEAVYGKSAG
jgi:ribosome-associated toxin RatA of RatAB toxin-antitoxin module